MSKLGEAYHRGWKQEDPERVEHYLSILNCLSEDEDFKWSRAELAEVLGWMQQQSHEDNEAYQELKSSLTRAALGLLKTVTDNPYAGHKKQEARQAKLKELRHGS